MERTVEPWGPDLHGPEDREPLRGARTGEGRGSAPPGPAKSLGGDSGARL